MFAENKNNELRCCALILIINDKTVIRFGIFSPYRMNIVPVILLFWTCLASFPAIEGLDNGLALTPPMGWLAWQRYRCITDCETYPDDCVKLVRFAMQ